MLGYVVWLLGESCQMHRKEDCDEKAGFQNQQTPGVITPVTGVAIHFPFALWLRHRGLPPECRCYLGRQPHTDLGDGSDTFLDGPQKASWCSECRRKGSPRKSRRMPAPKIANQTGSGERYLEICYHTFNNIVPSTTFTSIFDRIPSLTEEEATVDMLCNDFSKTHDETPSQIW